MAIRDRLRGMTEPATAPSHSQAASPAFRLGLIHQVATDLEHGGNVTKVSTRAADLVGAQLVKDHRLDRCDGDLIVANLTDNRMLEGPFIQG